jgi:hypothetical protein
VAVTYALVLGLFVYRDFRIGELPRIIVDTVETTGVVMALVMTASLLGYCISVSRLPQEFGTTLTSLTTNPIVYLLIVNLLLLVVGCFMEALAAMLVLIPILVPPAIASDRPAAIRPDLRAQPDDRNDHAPVGVVLLRDGQGRRSTIRADGARGHALSRAAPRRAGDDHLLAAADDVVAAAHPGSLMLTLPDLLHAGSGGDGNRAALLAPERAALCWADLLRQIAATLEALRGAGIGRADTVAVVLPNGPELATVSLRSRRAHAARRSIRPSARRVPFCLDDLGPAALLLAATDHGPLRTIAASCGVRCIDVHGRRCARRLPCARSRRRCIRPDDDAARPDDVALLLHTSGTTSRPKLVPLTHRNLCTSATNVVRTLGLSSRDRSLNLMPLFTSRLRRLAAGVARRGRQRRVPRGLSRRPIRALARCAAAHLVHAAPAIHQAVLAELARVRRCRGQPASLRRSARRPCRLQ